MTFLNGHFIFAYIDTQMVLKNTYLNTIKGAGMDYTYLGRLEASGMDYT